MCGLPGTGKTTAARHMAPAVHAEILSTDGVRRQILKECTLQEILESKDPMLCDIQRVFDALPSIPSKYQNMIWLQNEMVYEEVVKRTSYGLKEKSMILDGTFSKRKVRERLYETAKDSNQNPYVVYCICPEEIVKKRFDRRRATIDELSNVDKMSIYFKVKLAFEDPLQDDAPVITYDSEKLSVSIQNAERGLSSEISLIESLLESISAPRT